MNAGEAEAGSRTGEGRKAGVDGGTIAVLGPGGVGGLLAGALARAGTDVRLLAREETAATIAGRGLSVCSATLGEFDVSVPVSTSLGAEEDVGVLIIATKATGLSAALERVQGVPRLVLPLLNGLDHLTLLRERFDPDTVLASTIRVESDRPEPGVIVHTSRFLLIDMATRYQAALEGMQALARTLEGAGISTRVTLPVSESSEAQVMWSKLVRLNALACTTSAHDKLLGEIRSTPELRAELVGAIEEASAVGRAEGAQDVDARAALAELESAHDTLGSSMQRDIAAGRLPELDAIPGAVMRAGARNGLRCPTIARLVHMISARSGVSIAPVDL